MARILVLFASYDGQTARVAQRIGASLATAGHDVTMRSADADDAAREIEGHEAVIVGGAIRYGHFPRYLESLVRERSGPLASRPTAFYCVCLSARRPGDGQALARRYVAEFRARTGWDPRATAIFAGALLYRKYNPFLRLLMRFIAAATGGDTDTSRDYEYTDWPAVDRFAAEFASRIGGAGPA